MLIAGMHEIVRKTTIIREDDKSCGLLVEATNREYSLRDIDDIEDSFFIILTRETSCDDISRLVEYIVDEICLVSDDLIRELDLVHLGIDHLSDVCYDTIDCDETCLDVFLGLSTRTDTSMCEIFLEFQLYILETCIIGKNDKKAKNF
jgi:hypothetical protein